MELITDLKTINKEIGLRLEESSLYPKLNLDAYKDVTPILIKQGKQYALLLKEVETGNFTPGGAGEPVLKKRKVKVIYYSSYFTWDKIAQKRAEFPPDEVSALRKALKTKGFEIHPDMALDRYRRLAKGFELSFISKSRFKEKTWVYRIDPKKAESPFVRKRGVITRWALKAVDRELKMTPEDRRTVKKFLGQAPFRAFRVLDGLMKEKGISSLLASSPINLQEMLGIPYDQIREGLLGLYSKGKIYLLSQNPLKGFGVKKAEAVFPTLREAIGKLAGTGSIGVEEKNLDIGRALTLRMETFQNASNLFRAWREVRSGQDLGAYIVGALATKDAMEGALVMAAKKVAENRPVYEKDVERKFFSLLKQYEKKAKTPVQLRPYFVVLHAGTRTPYPSLPGNFRLSPRMNSLKLDAGILIKDQGLILACSDLARSIVMDPIGASLYGMLEGAMLKAAIPGGKEGCTGEELYWKGVKPLLREEKTIRSWKFLPANGQLKRDYNRDIGHTFGKQESTTLFFEKGEKGQKLRSGMVSAIEYHWPYNGYALGVEDMFVAGPRHGINITR